MKSHKAVSVFKHIFIPHEANEYKPHFFRGAVVIAIVSLSIFLLGVSVGNSFFLKKTVLGASVTASVLVDLANDSRLSYNEQPLVRNITLDRAAQMKGEDMVLNGYFAHDSPTGVTPWHWFKKAGYVFLYAGENLAINFSDSQDVNNAWLNSPKHRENLLNGKFKEVGMATVEGRYKNSETIFVVQMFGTPAKALSQTNKSPVTASPTSALSTGSSTTVAVNTVPQVKGETTNNVVPTTTLSDSTSSSVGFNEPTIIALSDSNDVAIVKNTDNVTPLEITMVENYETPWYGKFLFNGSSYIDILYKILCVIVVVALFTMIFIEVRRQHYKHIAYGVILLLVIVILMYANKTFINVF